MRLELAFNARAVGDELVTHGAPTWLAFKRHQHRAYIGRNVDRRRQYAERSLTAAHQHQVKVGLPGCAMKGEVVPTCGAKIDPHV